MMSMDSDDETDWSLDQIHSVYESRFLTEYQPLKLLGRGNFSRVFEANKISDAKHYAIKRIKLPLGKESRSQIMKQLTILSEVNHRNIVKYFDAWREFPPTGWQDSQDASQMARLSSSSVTDANDDDKKSTANKNKPAASFALIFGANSLSASTNLNQMKRRRESDPLELATPPGVAKNNASVDQFLYIRMELCRKESLAEWLVTYHQPAPNTKRQDVIAIFREVLHAVQHLHLKELIHRDLKPSNIFFASDGTIKVGDLGLAKDCHQLYVTQSSLSSTSSPSWTNNEQTKPADLISGSQERAGREGAEEDTRLLYTSPEQLQSRKYNHKVDVYALAVILFELLVPFTSNAERYNVIAQLKSTLTFPPTFHMLHPQAETLLIKMLSYNPDHRPEVKTILADAWISGRIRDSSNVTRRSVTSTPGGGGAVNRSNNRPRFKILVIGDQNTGKTSIIHRYIHGEFLDPLRQSQATLGAVVQLKHMTWNENENDDKSFMKREMTLEFCDIGGEERSRFMTSAFYRKAVGAFVVMDVTQPNGFQAATLWKKDLDMKLRMHDDSLVPSVLLINKCDSPSMAKYSSSELDPAQVDRFCRQNKFTGWFDTSALNDININEAVQLLLGKILANEAASNKEPAETTTTVQSVDDDRPRKLDQSQSTQLQQSKSKRSNCC